MHSSVYETMREIGVKQRGCTQLHCTTDRRRESRRIFFSYFGEGFVVSHGIDSRYVHMDLVVCLAVWCREKAYDVVGVLVGCDRLPNIFLHPVSRQRSMSVFARDVSVVLSTVVAIAARVRCFLPLRRENIDGRRYP